MDARNPKISSDPLHINWAASAWIYNYIYISGVYQQGNIIKKRKAKTNSNMAIRAFPLLCTLFLLLTSSIELPYTEATHPPRTLQESKAGCNLSFSIPSLEILFTQLKCSSFNEVWNNTSNCLPISISNTIILLVLGGNLKSITINIIYTITKVIYCL
jgi:hypothetical protein